MTRASEKGISLTWRLAFWFFVVALLPLTLFGYLSLRQTEAASSGEIQSRLARTADRKLMQIKSYLKERTQDTELLARSSLSAMAIADLSHAYAHYGANSAKYRMAAKPFDKSFAAYIGNYEDTLFYDVFLITPQGEIIYTNKHESDFATNLISGPHRDTQLAKTFIESRMTLESNLSNFEYYAPSVKTAAFVSAPIIRDGTLLGVIAFQLDMDHIYREVSNNVGLGITGETVLAQLTGPSNAMFIAPISHDPEAAKWRMIDLKSGPVPIRNALSGKIGSGVAIDYFGKQIVASWRYMPELSWGMVVKMDVDEAFAPIYQQRRNLLGMLLALSVFGGMVAFYFGRQIVVSLRAFAHTADEIAQGDLSKRIDETRTDEIGALACSFNNMTGNLQLLYSTLEDRVEERTRDLNVSNEQLQEEIIEREHIEKALLEREQEFRILAETVPQIIWITRPDGWIVYLNHHWVDYTGLTLEESLGQGWNIPFHPDDQKRAWDAWQHATQTDTIYSLECRLRRADGVYRWWLMRGISLHDESGKIVKWFGTCTDIDDIKQSEEELSKHRHHLEELVTQRTTELVTARQQAETANRAKSAFLANMSHELRTPLNAILGFSDILRRDKSISEAQKETLTTIHKSGDHLLNLINDVLDISKIESGKVELQLAPFDLGNMIADVTDMLRIRAKDKGLQLLVDQPAEFPRHILGDEAKLRQILINLISNAIKATERGGIVLRLGMKGNHSDHLIFEVEDTGIGIAPKDQIRIFEPFVQLDSDGKRQGTGLGLSITRQYVDMLGGNLTLTSTEGQGSTFRLELPVQLAQEDEVTQRITPRGEVISLAAGQSSCLVLIVEDNAENRLLLQHLLESVGFQVLLAENGAEGVEQFTQNQPPFIWMDRRMPVMDGMEATRRIRALPGGDQVKIVAVTASTFTDEDSELFAAGFDAIVHKPYRPDQIFDSMENLLGIKFARDKLNAKSKHEVMAELDAADFAALPEDLREELAQALAILDGERIFEVINRIAQSAPELAAALSARAKSYDYAPILDLMQACHSKST